VVLIRLAAGKEKSALAKIKDTKGVSHVSGVYGRWDLICDVEADDLLGSLASAEVDTGGRALIVTGRSFCRRHTVL
jgi:hypothetical protein